MKTSYHSQMKSYMNQVRLLGHKDFIDVGRESLNQVALLSKRRYIPAFAQDKFTVRRKNFFTAMTAVNFAKRKNDNTLTGMFSEVGFIKDDSTENMEVQEFGGVILRPIKPANTSRISNSYEKRVSKTKMFKMNPKNMIRQSSQRTRHGQSGNAKQRFMIAMRVAEKSDSQYFLADEFRSIYRKKGARWERVYSYEENNKEKIKASNLIKDSGEKSMESLPDMFVKSAQEKINFRAGNLRW